MKTVTYFIRELKVERIVTCKKITDAGIQGLSVSVNLGKLDQRLGQCKSIETLIIVRTIKLPRKESKLL